MFALSRYPQKHAIGILHSTYYSMQLSNSAVCLCCGLQSSQSLKGLSVSLFDKRKRIGKCLTGFQENLRVTVRPIIKKKCPDSLHQKNADLYLWDRKKLYSKEELQQNQKKSGIFVCFSTLVETAFFLNQSQVKNPFTKAKAQFFFDEFSTLN